MSASRRKAFLVSVALVGGTLLMTACQDTDGNAAPSAPSAAADDKAATPPAASDGGGDKGSAEQGSGAPAGSKDGNKVEKCRTNGLKITATDATIDGDGENTVAVELRNTSGKDCAISGYAGVDLKTNQGALSAKRSGEPVVPAILKNGEMTAFGIHYPENKSGGSGVRITGLVVTPPDETNPVTLKWPGAATLPVTDGSGSPVKIGPMGSAGQGGAGS
ncbi:DUF4232 domain-containing protein [Streptomyces sp. NPDC004111]|uniref:DUF4232 domain-containing protein n=1 Tax=Streptomyces sp. NPDC004111 TaxID=3364690 RepID=UPI0036A4E0FE